MKVKKFSNTFLGFDKKVDRIVNPFWKHFKKYFPIFSAVLLGLLLILFFIRIFVNKPYFASGVLTSDISKIEQALNKIDYDCSILSIENDQNPIDFLTVKSFVGSEVGCLNVAYPKNWQGPYLLDSPRFQGKLYQLVKTKLGNFVIPGNFTKLPNGQAVGKSFKITYDSDIAKMLKDGGELNYKGISLGKKLEFKIGDLGKVEMKTQEMDKISKALEEFNQAMPFTYNQTTSHSKI